MKKPGLTTLPPDTIAHDRSSSSTSTPAISHVPYAKPEPAKTVSNLPSLGSLTLVADDSFSRPNVQSAPNSARKTKYATKEERRRAISIALKQRWASGAMDNAPKKRLQTMRRRKEAEALLGTPGIAKSSSRVGGLELAGKSSASSNRFPHLPGLTAPRPHDARKRSVISDKIAHFMDDSILAAKLTSSPSRLSHYIASTKMKAACEAAPTNGYLDEVDSEIEDSVSLSASSISHSTQAAEQASGKDESKNGIELPAPITMATTDRAYTKWRDEKGSLRPTYGALIPEGYQLSTTIAKHPWICPSKHRGAQLHDNEDGTFSERRIGRLRRLPNEASAPLPAVVVSRGPPDSAESPVVTPSISSYRVGKSNMDGRDGNTAELEDEKDEIDPDTLSITSDLVLDDGMEGDASALWYYIQPYLVKHKGRNIPSSGWVQELLSLPRIRDPDWNEAWISTHPYKDTLTRDISALVLQITGEIAPKPCKRCSKGLGLFKSCVVISRKANEGPIRSIISCANCFYHCGQKDCTHKQWGRKRAAELLKSRGSSGHIDKLYDEIEDEEQSQNDSADDEEDTNGEDDKDMGPIKEDTREEKFIVLDGVSNSIVDAEPGRPYTMWPAGYQLDTTIPGRPWRAHFAACLNDNCDGTFTVKGFYQDKATSVGKGGKILVDAPPVVVSRIPLASGSPIPKAQLPPYLNTHRPSLGIREGAEPELRRIKPGIPGPKEGEVAHLWAYIQPRLVSTTEMPSNMTVKHLLTLPKQRDVKYNTHRRRKPFRENSSQDIAAMVIQVIGDEASAMCKRCRQGKGPFKGCVVVPKTANEEARQRYPCCSNCLFGGKMLYCTLTRSTRKRGSLATSEGFSRPGVPAPSKRVTEASVPTVPRITQSVVTDRSSTTPAFSSPSGPSVSSTLTSQSTFRNSSNMLELEDWEIAPGRIRGTSTAESEAIAFSKPYLSTPGTPQGAVPVCDDVAFRVDTVQPGHELRLEAEADKTRLCSVAAGKVRITIGAEPEFAVGPHGLFKVPPGAECTVQNGLGFDAVVHTVVLGGY
ncbi:hypothetical protein C7999DRAFT_13707 [Corynascus novoguineensis]|uniref:Uncharacterized protein n=1 Tax=Corynascus novoguineensis TaxID=1126955 RepID=A0AAN7CUT4_9PEZI|nr:hypothetical protein C7999DRAFT_13707 [Corynascus novoguineensis]